MQDADGEPTCRYAGLYVQQALIASPNVKGVLVSQFVLAAETFQHWPAGLRRRPCTVYERRRQHWRLLFTWATNADHDAAAAVSQEREQSARQQSRLQAADPCYIAVGSCEMMR